MCRLAQCFWSQSEHGLLSQRAPLVASSYADRTSMSEPPPMGNWSDWGKHITVDMATARQYAQAVYAATHVYLAGMEHFQLDSGQRLC